MKQQRKQEDLGQKKMPQSAQDKGLMLARLLEKAVQNKKNSINSINTNTIKSDQNHNVSKQSLSSLQQQKHLQKHFLQQTLSQSINQTSHTITLQETLSVKQPPRNINLNESSNDSKPQTVTKNRETYKDNHVKDLTKQIFLKQALSKQGLSRPSKSSTFQMRERFSLNASEISLDDSLLIDPSFATNYAEQVGQMLQYIYVQIFGLEQYQLDFKRYQQIQANPDFYKIDPTQEFNKEGKLLENIICEIKTLKNTLNKQKTHSHQLNSELDQAYAKIQLQSTQISSLQESIMRLEKKLVVQEEKVSKIQKINKMDEKSIGINQEYERILEENEAMQGALGLLQEENIKFQQTISELKVTIQKLQLELEERKYQLQNALIEENEQCSLLQEQRQEKADKQVRLEQKIISLQKNIDERDNEIENLLSIVGQLQNELNQIKQDIQNKENTQIKQKRQMQKQIQSLTDQYQLLLRQNNKQKTNSSSNPIQNFVNYQSEFDISKLSTIKEDKNQQEQIYHPLPITKRQNLTDISEFNLDNVIKQNNNWNIKHQLMSEKQAQTQSHHQQDIHFKTLYHQLHHQAPNTSQVQRLVLELKKLLTHKEKTILMYERQIESHESEVEKYESFIAQLSSQIQQLKISTNNHKAFREHKQQSLHKNLQTNIKPFSEIGLLKSDQGAQQGQQELKQKQSTPQQEEQYKNQMSKINLFPNSLHSISKQQINYGQTLGEGSNIEDISGIMIRQQFLDEVSVTLSQFSETEELNDIRKLIKQLSQAYDKIISLTYEITSLKKHNPNNQPVPIQP